MSEEEEVNQIIIETVSIYNVLKDFSIADSYGKYIKFNPPVEFTLDLKKTETLEETIERFNQIYRESGIDALAETLRDEGFYISNIDYLFEQPFTEEITICALTIDKRIDI